MASRLAISQARRIVVKIGSTSLTCSDGRINARRLYLLVTAVADARARGQEVVIVSSGAVAAGLAPLGFKHPPRDLASKQAAAAVGQRVLVEKYGSLFADFDIHVAQVLLTVDDLTRQSSYRNALRTLNRLLELGVVPIVNENDTVATQELRFGDNDRLAALVSHLVDADAFVMLSDVDGLYSDHPENPGARFIEDVPDIDSLEAKVSGNASVFGTGGMATKVDAARVATGAGIPVALAHADQIVPVLAGQRVGTFFHPSGKKRSRKLLWLAHISQTQGVLVLDRGAVRAISAGTASLLPAGIIQVSGEFHAGDPVDLVTETGRVIARGFVHYDAEDLPVMLGRTTTELAAKLGDDYANPVVHRDQLVLLEKKK